LYLHLHLFFCLLSLLLPFLTYFLLSFLLSYLISFVLLYLILQRLVMQQFYWISVPLFDLDHYMFRPLHKAIFRWMFCGPCYTYTRRHMQVAPLFT
jgi:hypothetical protein